EPATEDGRLEVRFTLRPGQAVVPRLPTVPADREVAQAPASRGSLTPAASPVGPGPATTPAVPAARGPLLYDAEGRVLVPDGGRPRGPDRWRRRQAPPALARRPRPRCLPHAVRCCTTPRGGCWCPTAWSRPRRCLARASGRWIRTTRWTTAGPASKATGSATAASATWQRSRSPAARRRSPSS